MFGFLHRVRKNSELESYLERIHNNESNNYKDAAQEYFRTFDKRLTEMTEAGTLKEEQVKYYEGIRSEIGHRLKGYSHKEQKPYWT